MRTADEIRAELRALAPRWAELASRHEAAGVNGLTMFDCVRKIELARIENSVRETAARAGVKMTEAAVDAQAHAAPGYVAFIERALAERTEYVALAAERALLIAELRVIESRETFEVPTL